MLEGIGMKVAFVILGGLLAVASSGCGNCLAICISEVTFRLATPVAGTDFAVTIGSMNQQPDSLDCRAGDASLSCTPSTSAVEPMFDGSGALTSVSLADPPAGNYRVQIAVDGVPTIDAAFQYDRPTSGMICGSTCHGQVFTIDN